MKRGNFREDKAERLRTRPYRRHPKLQLFWQMLHSGIPGCDHTQPFALHVQGRLIRPSSLGAKSTTRAASGGYPLFQSPLLEQPCLATAWLLLSALLHQRPSSMFKAAQQQVALEVSPRMRIDVSHQAPVPELIQTTPGFCEVQRGEFLKLPYTSRTPVHT